MPLHVLSLTPSQFQRPSVICGLFSHWVMAIAILTFHSSFYSTGIFASGTPIVKTQGKHNSLTFPSILIAHSFPGSANVDCVGLVSSSGNSTIIKEQEDAAAAAVKARKRKSIIIGVCVTLAGLILIAGTVLVVLHKRKRQQEWEQEYGPDTTARQFEERDDGQVLTIPPSTPGNLRSPKSGSAPPSAALTSSNYAGAPTFDPYRSVRESSSGQQLSAVSSSNTPGFSNTPIPIRRSQKGLEAGLPSPQSDTSGRPGSAVSADSRAPLTMTRSSSAQASGSDQTTPPPSRSNNAAWPTRSASLQASGVNPDTPLDGADIIYQHRDGGGVVRELPPPYADRNAPNPAP